MPIRVLINCDKGWNGRERGTERERQRDRQTDRQTDRQIISITNLDNER